MSLNSLHFFLFTFFVIIVAASDLLAQQVAKLYKELCISKLIDWVDLLTHSCVLVRICLRYKYQNECPR